MKKSNAHHVEVIAHGCYTDACRAIGEADLPTILEAEQHLCEGHQLAATQGLPCRSYIGLLKLVRGRRRRLLQEAIQRQQQGTAPATFRL